MSTRGPRKASEAEILHRLDLLLAICLSAFALSTFYYYAMDAYCGSIWPWSTPLYDPAHRFSDFTKMTKVCREIGTAATASLYPPGANLYFWAFAQVPEILGLSLFLLAPVICLLWYARTSLDSVPAVKGYSYLMGIYLISHPFLFAMDRANLELHLFIFLAIFTFLFRRKERWARMVASLCLAIPISFKVYPALLTVLYLRERRWREFWLTIGAIVSITVIGLVVEGGVIDGIKAFFENVAGATKLNHWIAARYNLSAYNAVRTLMEALDAAQIAKDGLDQVYTPLCIAVIGVVTFVVLNWSYSVWQVMTAMICLMCVLPKLSNDYRLLLLLVPLPLFIRESGPWTSQNRFICVLFGALLIPKGQIVLHYLNSRDSWGPGLATPASFLNPLLLAALAVLVLWKDQADLGMVRVDNPREFSPMRGPIPRLCRDRLPV